MVKNFISADEAKHLAETSEKLLNNVFKVIKDAATYGRCTTDFDICDAAPVTVNKLTGELLRAGYTLETISNEDGKDIVLVISW